MHTATATIEINGRTYEATVEGDRVELAVDGIWAGNGTWAADRGVIEDCAAAIDDDAYDALEAALAAAAN